MRALDVHEGRVIVSPEAMALPVIRTLYKRDKSKKKERAFDETCFVVYMTDPRKANPYSALDETKRREKLIKDVLDGREPDKELEKAVKWWAEYWQENIPEMEIWQDAKEAATSLMDYLKNVDYTERTNSGAMVANPGQVASTLSKVNTILQQLAGLGKKIQEEAYELVRARGGREINPLER